MQPLHLVQTEQKAIYAELNKGADQCKKCKKCEKVCPQSIKISHTMTEIAKIFAK